jgi:hypothetical protein
METLSIVLVMLAAVVVSGALSRMVPFNLPTPLIQIALGYAIGLVAQIRVDLKPDIFFLLFLPPLLFLDGWRIPKEALFRDRAVILELALGLVMFTVVGLGFPDLLDDPGDAAAGGLRARRHPLADRSDRGPGHRRPRADPQAADAYP